MPPARQGLRAEPGEFPGPGTARRLPLPHAKGRARDKGMIHENMMISRTCDSGFQHAPAISRVSLSDNRIVPSVGIVCGPIRPAFELTHPGHLAFCQIAFSGTAIRSYRIGLFPVRGVDAGTASHKHRQNFDPSCVTWGNPEPDHSQIGGRRLRTLARAATRPVTEKDWYQSTIGPLDGQQIFRIAPVFSSIAPLDLGR